MWWQTAQCRRAWYVQILVFEAEAGIHLLNHTSPKSCRIATNRTPAQPYKVYHGKTGVVYNVTKNAVGVILYKQVGNRYIEKRINVRVEHVRSSRSREEFLTRVKDNAAKKRKAKEEGTQMYLKRQPKKPREERTVSAKDNKPETIVPIAYETTI
jgi:large subunit ribosomal protein L21e